jgi:hypothetical protein
VKSAAKSAKTSARKKSASGTSKVGRAPQDDSRSAVEAWLDHVNPTQRPLVRRLDQLIVEAVPGIVCAVKFRRPTNPWGVPFYGLPARGWIVSVNSLKASVRLILFAASRSSRCLLWLRRLKPAESTCTPTRTSTKGNSRHGCDRRRSFRGGAASTDMTSPRGRT